MGKSSINETFSIVYVYQLGYPRTPTASTATASTARFRCLEREESADQREEDHSTAPHVHHGREVPGGAEETNTGEVLNRLVGLTMVFIVINSG